MTLLIGFLFSALVFALLVLFVWLFSSPRFSLLSAYRFDKLAYTINSREKNIEQTIDQQHPFYKTLTAKQRKEFLWRVYYFIKTTEFVIKFDGDRSVIEPTIAFTAAQMSLGLSIRCYTQYEKVIVYEDDYLSTHSQQYHKGEVHPGAGTILFSWNSILFGLSDHYDGINLLVHEFAHALRLEHKMRGDQYEIFDDDNFLEFEKQAREVLENIRTVEDHFFRKYAATNLDEFFAVASENFFERPGELNDNFPKLYEAFKKLYNQGDLKLTGVIPSNHESDIK